MWYNNSASLTQEQTNVGDNIRHRTRGGGYVRKVIGSDNAPAERGVIVGSDCGASHCELRPAHCVCNPLILQDSDLDPPVLGAAYGGLVIRDGRLAESKGLYQTPQVQAVYAD
jgi:hypothetical protein